MNWIVWGIVWLTISEICYILLCRTAKKRELVNTDEGSPPLWFIFKMAMLIVGGIVTGAIYGISLLNKQGFIIFGYVIGGIVLLIYFFMCNRWVALKVAKK